MAGQNYSPVGAGRRRRQYLYGLCEKPKREIRDVATIRARGRLGHPNSEIDASLGAEEIQIQLDDKKTKLGTMVPDRDRK